MGAAIRERLGGAISQGSYVTHSDASGMTVTEIAGLDIVCGDVSTPEAARFGVTAELTSMTPYTIPHAWAAALHAHGLDGIRYTPRFTPGAEAWAVFGPSGAHALGTVFDSFDGVTACRTVGFRILPPPPRASALTITKPPKR